MHYISSSHSISLVIVQHLSCYSIGNRKLAIAVKYIISFNKFLAPHMFGFLLQNFDFASGKLPQNTSTEFMTKPQWGSSKVIDSVINKRTILSKIF
jgi:hypothetical protein